MATEPQILSSFSPRACPWCMLTCFSAGDPPSTLYICRGPSTNQLLFMQNKPNFRKSQMNVSIFSKMDYENLSDWTLGQNKPNSNPIKPNFRKAQMNINSLITKDYIKNDDFAVRKNKPNSNPISVKPKMNANAFLQKDYENEPPSGPKKTNPKQTQSKPVLSAVEWANFFKGQNELKIACRKIRPHPFQQTKKKFWTIPNKVVKITVLDELSI